MDRKARLLSSNKYIYLVERKNREAYLANKHTSKIPVIESLKTINYEGKKKQKQKQKQRQRQQRQDITCNINEISKYEK